MLLALHLTTLSAQSRQADSIFTDLPAKRYAISDGRLPVYAAQFPVVGAVDYDVRLDYPEYERLTAAEIALIRQWQLSVPTAITPQAVPGISRKETLLNVSFSPIVCRDGHYERLVSCKIVVTPQQAVPRLKTIGTRAVADRWSHASVLASGHWIKVRVAEEGIYELTASQLSRWGFSDPSRVKVYGYGGRIQAENWDFTSADRVPDDLNEVALYRRDGSLLFFAEGTVRWTWNASLQQWIHAGQPYSRYSYYFITEGDSPASFTRLDDVSATSQTVTSFTHHAVRDDDAENFYGGGRELYDAYNFANGSTHTYRLPAPGLITGQTATVGIALGAANANGTTRADISLNGATLGSMTVNRYGSDESAYERRSTFTTANLAADNAFAFAVTAGIDARLNYIRLTYPCALDAAVLTSSFTPGKSGSATLSISNATGTTRLWRIATADAPAAEVAGTLNGTTYEARVADASARYIIVDTGKSYASPEYAGEVENQNLHADTGVDMVIIIPTSGKLREQAQRIADAHAAKDNLTVKIVTAGQLYNEFSSGTPDASAYRRYMKMLYDRAATADEAPRYLLLFGDCAWDNRMVSSEWSGQDPDDYLLSFEVNDGYSDPSTANISLGTLRSYVTDDYYGWLDDSEGTTYARNMLDLAIGRYPCHDAATAKVLVDKTLDYMNNKVVGAWKNKVYILGDEGDNTLHMRGAESVAQTLNNACDERLILRKVYWDAYPRTLTATGFSYPQVTAKMQEYMRQGALIFNYIGHGSPDQISHAGLLYTSDFATSSSGRMPLWIMASCEITPYDSQRDDIGRTALYNTGGGAVAVVCASRSVYASYNTALNQTYLASLLSTSTEATMGESLRKAKVALLTGDGGYDMTINKLKYVLLGDPALKLMMPRGEVVLDSINGQTLGSGVLVQLKAGSVARFSGHVRGTASSVATEFNGHVTATLADREETITCLNNVGDNTVMTYKDRTKTVFEGSDSITAGRFTMEIAIPRDISYTTDCGRISFYAVNSDRSLEANGYNEQFYLNGTADGVGEDTVAPTVYAYLDTPDFINGGLTSTSPVFMAEVADDAGINVSGISVGHDMTLVVDGQTTQTIVLNEHFSYDFGSYRSGTVTYQLSDLAPGEHTLVFKAWDVNNNATTARLDFTVGTTPLTAFDVNATRNPATTSTNFVTIMGEDAAAGGTLTLDVYDIAGRKVWTRGSTCSSTYSVETWDLHDANGSPLPAGLYFYKATLETAVGRSETNTKKIILLKQ